MPSNRPLPTESYPIRKKFNLILSYMLEMAYMWYAYSMLLFTRYFPVYLVLQYLNTCIRECVCNSPGASVWGEGGCVHLTPPQRLEGVRAFFLNKGEPGEPLHWPFLPSFQKSSANHTSAASPASHGTSKMNYKLELCANGFSKPSPSLCTEKLGGRFHQISLPNLQLPDYTFQEWIVLFYFIF